MKMSLRLAVAICEIFKRMPRHYGTSKFYDKHKEDIDAAVDVVSHLALISSEKPSVSPGRVFTLLHGRFPCSKVSLSLFQEALFTPCEESSIYSVLDRMFKVRVKTNTLFPGSEDWKEIQRLVENLPISVLRLFLKEKYEKGLAGEALSGYYFLVILKMLSGHPLPLPSWETSHSEELKVQSYVATLNMYFEACPQPMLMMRLFEDLPKSLGFMTECLVKIPLSQWNKKINFIVLLLTRLESHEKIMVIRNLCSSLDKATRDIGSFMLSLVGSK